MNEAHRLRLDPIATPDRLLLGPGPSNADPRVLQAIARPPLSHLDPLYLELMNEVQEMLRYAWQTDNRFTIPVSGTGSAAMEATIANTVEAGETVVVGVIGYFGKSSSKNIKVLQTASKDDAMSQLIVWKKTTDREEGVAEHSVNEALMLAKKTNPASVSNIVVPKFAWYASVKGIPSIANAVLPYANGGSLDDLIDRDLRQVATMSLPSAPATSTSSSSRMFFN